MGPSTSVKDIQTFLGFANFYRRFIQSYSEVVSPSTALTKKGIKFEWSSKADATFQALTAAFNSTPVLMHFEPQKPTIVETGASDYVSAGILSQHDYSYPVHPLAFYSKKPECNYEIWDKELLAVIHWFEE